MARTSRIVLAALLVLTLLPTTGPVAAQADGGSAALVPLFSDGFDSLDDNGWTTNTRSTGDNGLDKWSRTTDGDKPESPKVWYASRLSGDGKPAGYSNNADVFVVSPTIPLTPGFFPRSVGVVLRGSSEAYDGQFGDYLALQWAPSSTAQDADWQTLKVWSGVDAKLEPSYQFVEVSSTKLLQHRGDMVFRFRFQSDADCDSNPGDTAIEPVVKRKYPFLEFHMRCMPK